MIPGTQTSCSSQQAIQLKMCLLIIAMAIMRTKLCSRLLVSAFSKCFDGCTYFPKLPHGPGSCQKYSSWNKYPVKLELACAAWDAILARCNRVGIRLQARWRPGGCRSRV